MPQRGDGVESSSIGAEKAAPVENAGKRYTFEPQVQLDQPGHAIHDPTAEIERSVERDGRPNSFG